jgi:hypothetical protein
MSEARFSRAKPPVIGLVAIVLLAGCKIGDSETALEAINVGAFDARLQFLSSDLLEGRAPGTRGARLAADYIAAQFAQAGLQPVGDASSYFQPVPLVARLPDPRLSFRALGGASIAPAHGSEFVAWSQDTAVVTSLEAELVFAGYGITAPEYDWDDYEDEDVSGKVLLVLAGDPGRHVSERFRGDTATRYGLASYKLKTAAQRGAVGVVMVHDPEFGHDWSAIRSVRSGEQLELDDGSAPGGVAFGAWVTSSVAEQVAAMAGLDFETLLETARDDRSSPIETGVTVSASVTSRTRRFSGANVAGLLPGSHPELASEFVVFTAHYDHLGIGEPLDVDSIYNGAYDNASGTALLLCLAEAFGRMERRPARSILFLAVTAKEAGLLGSKHFVENPLVPLSRTVANINFDGVNLWGPTEDMVIIKADDSDVWDAALFAASDEDLRLESGWPPGWEAAYRSDHFSFFEAGVPAALLAHGLDYVGRMPGWGSQMLDHYSQALYHKPGDEYQPGLDLRGAVQQGRVAFRLGLRLSNRRTRP